MVQSRTQAIPHDSHQRRHHDPAKRPSSDLEGDTVAESMNDVAWAKETDLMVHLTMLTGFAWETREEPLHTFELVRKLMLDSYRYLAGHHRGALPRTTAAQGGFEEKLRSTGVRTFRHGRTDPEITGVAGRCRQNLQPDLRHFHLTALYYAPRQSRPQLGRYRLPPAQGLGGAGAFQGFRALKISCKV